MIDKKDFEKIADRKIDLTIKWRYYLARPFNLFQASIWHEWYNSEAFYDIFGMKWPNGLFIENPKGMCCQYREEKVLKSFFKKVRDIRRSQKTLNALLNEGLILNKQAEKLLQKNTLSDLESVVNFSARLLHCAATVPYFVGEAHQNEKVKQLRAVSYYPRVLKELIVPLALRRLSKFGIQNRAALQVMTYQELLNGKILFVGQRLAQVTEGKQYVFQTLHGKETVSFVETVQPFVSVIEGDINKENLLKGISASKGKAKGKVRLVHGNGDHISVTEGDILVAVSTSPTLLPLIKKAAAIITDEGGMTSHAAIISRELGKPCIVGTKNATKWLKDGDLVEVNANKGTIKKL